MTIPLQLTEEALAHHLPYWWAGDGALVLHDGTISLGWSLAGVDTTTLPAGDVNTIAERLRSALNTLAPKATAQFLRHVRPVPDTTWEAYGAQLRTDDALLKELRRQTARHLQAQQFRVAETYLFLTAPQALGRMGTRNATGLTRLLNRATRSVDPATLTRQAHAQALDALQKGSAPFLRSLGAAKLRLDPLDDSALARLAFQFLNPARAARGWLPELVDDMPPEELPQDTRKLYVSLSLREQLAHSSLSWSSDVIYLDDPPRPHRILALKALPQRTIASQMRLADHLTFEHWLSVSVTALDTVSRFEGLERQRNRAQSAAAGHARNIRAVNRAKDLDAAMDAIDARDQRLYNLSLHLLYGADDLVELDRRTQAVLDRFARGRLPLAVAHQAQFFAWQGMLPAAAHRATHPRTILTDTAADLLPVFDAWKGNERPLLLLSHRTDELFALDIADPKRTTWNSLVFGGSGGGKSFLTLSLITSSMLAQGSDVIVVDVGGGEVGSYYRLCKLLGGDFVDLNLDGRNAINPFPEPATLYLDQDGKPSSDPNPLRLLYLRNITQILVTDARTPTLGRVADAVLLGAIHATYRRLHDRAPTYEDLLVSLSDVQGDEEDREEARRMAKVLRASLSGPIGKLINTPARPPRARNRFTVFDMAGLEALGDLAPVMLLVISAHIWNMVGRQRDRLAWIVYDECWALMKYPTAAEVQTALYRTARKLGVGVLSVTQKLADFLAVPSARAIVSNSNLHFLLRHNKDDIPAVSEVLELNPRERELLDDIKNEKGRFAEVLLRQTDGASALLRHSPSPLEYWVNTTDPADRELEKHALAACGGDRLRAIQQLVSTHPHGAAGAKRPVNAS